MKIAALFRRGAVRTAALALSVAAALHAHADSFTYDVELRATAIGRGQTVFGFDVPPATSFLGRLSLTADLHSGSETWPGSGLFEVTPTIEEFDITIGTTSWTMAGSHSGRVWTDHQGIVAFNLYFLTEPGFRGSTLAIEKGAVTNLDWYASDRSVGDGTCVFGPAGVIEGACMTGDVGSARLTMAVPEPSQLRLLATAFAAAMALLAARRGYRRGFSAGVTAHGANRGSRRR
jgi:hypothetical protein